MELGCGWEVWSTICRRHTWKRLRWWLIVARASHCWQTNLKKLQRMHLTTADTWWDDSSLLCICENNSYLNSFRLGVGFWSFRVMLQESLESVKVANCSEAVLKILCPKIFDWNVQIQNVSLITGNRLPTCWWRLGLYWDFSHFGQTSTCRPPGGYIFHLETLGFLCMINMSLVPVQVAINQSNIRRIIC